MLHPGAAGPEGPRRDADPVAPNALYRRLRALVGLLVRVFFRRVEVVGLEHVPQDRGGILVAWHPNGLVDPALILAAFPRPVVFGARAGLFRLPLLGPFVAALGSVPIYRRQDVTEDATAEDGVADEERRRRNDESLDALAERIAQGSFSALFPEGISHDSPFLQELKTGAARLYYRARALAPPGALPPVVIPVGIHYDHKRLFRSRALVEFHPPLQLPAELDVSPAAVAGGVPDHAERTKQLARGLTERIDAELRAVVMETESWKIHQLFHRARALVRAERAARAGATLGAPSMQEMVLGMARIWTGYRERVRTQPEEVKALLVRLARYDRDLRGLDMDDHELDRPPPVFRLELWLILMSQVVSLIFLLPPFLAVGYLVNLPTALLIAFLAQRIGRVGKDYASLKLLGGIAFFPVTWALWAWLAAWVSTHPRVQALAPWLPDEPLLAAALMVPLAILGGVATLVYVELARGTWRALRVRLTRGVRARALLRLRVERGELADAVMALSQGLTLPGVVEPDGRIGPRPRVPAGRD